MPRAASHPGNPTCVRTLARGRLWLAAAILLTTPTGFASAQQTAPPPTSPQSAKQSPTTWASEQKKLWMRERQEAAAQWKKWLNEDVVYIITDDEKAAFRRLQTDEERRQFADQFWRRLDPTPDTEENEYKDEHYRRIAYANERFASPIPGWKTDRGRIYIRYGPPDEITACPMPGQVPDERVALDQCSYPTEQWRYGYLPGFGRNVEFGFVDVSLNGIYRLYSDPIEKPLERPVQARGPGKPERLAQPGTPANVGESDVLPPPPGPRKLAELKAALASRAAVVEPIRHGAPAMEWRMDQIKLTEATDLALVTLRFPLKDLQFAGKDGIARATIDLYGLISKLDRQPVTSFEDTVEVSVPAEMIEQARSGARFYFKSIPLPSGTYRLDIAAKDVLSGNIITIERALMLPAYDDEHLASSSVILSDIVVPADRGPVADDELTVRLRRVRPRMSATFRQDETLSIYAELYNLGMGETSLTAEGTVAYRVIDLGSRRSVFYRTEDLSYPNDAPSLVVIDEKLSLLGFHPGEYSLAMTVYDKVKKQTLALPEITFTVTAN